MTNNINTKSKLLFVVWAFAISIITHLLQSHSQPSIASHTTPEQFIQSQIDAAISISQNKEMSDTAKTERLLKLLNSTIDQRWMARFAIGSSWKDLNEEQKTTYIELYKKYLISIYSPYLTKLENKTLRVTSSKDNGANNHIVTVKVKDENDTEIEIAYRCFINKDQTIKIRDMTVEKISMITTHRAQFKSIIQRNGVEGLISSLKSH